MAENTSLLPGLQYKSALTVEDYTFLEGVYSDEFLTRWLSAVGDFRLAGPSFGIVAETRPSDASTSQTTLPLVVAANVIQPLTVDVNIGLAFTENGNFTRLEVNQEQLALSQVDEGDVNVIFLEYLTVLSENRISIFSQTNVPAHRARGTDIDGILQVASLTDWLDPVKFTAKRKKDVIVLAVSTIVDTNGILLQSIDMSQNNFTFVRPWYSIVDIQHRQQLGTGTPTSSNPHGTGINDLSAGNITLYRQFLETGAILSKALDAPHVPGLLCNETIPAAVVLTDTTGNVTAGSRYGGVGTQYVFLQFYPTTMSSCWETGIPQNSLSVDVVPGTTILVFSPRETIPSGGVTVNYFHVFALEPPSIITSNTIVFSQPQEKRELIISNGVAFDDVDTPQANLEASGPIPTNFTVVVDGSENFITLPQRLLGPIKLSAMGTTVQNISTSMYGEARIKIGLTRATASPSLAIDLEIIGTDENGLAVSPPEILSFGSTWEDVSIPGAETAIQFVYSTRPYKTITSIKRTKRENDGANSTIIVYADIKPFVTTNLSETCPVVDVVWDGAAVSSIVDKRLFIPSLSYTNRKNKMLAMSNAYLMGTIAALNSVIPEPLTAQLNSTVYVEDFNDPEFLDTLQIDAEPTSAVGTIQVFSNTDVADGDTINIATDKNLSAKDRIFGLSVGAQDLSTNLPLTNLSLQSDTTFNILVDNDVAGFQEVVFGIPDLSALTTGVLISAALEAKIQAIGIPSTGTVDYSKVQVDFNGQDYAFGSTGVYTIRSGTSGTGSSVVIVPGASANLTDDLLLGLAATPPGAEAVGTDNDFTIGEFDIGDTGADTRDNIISTIADATFNPGMTASIGTAINTVDLIQTATGAVTNFSIVVTTETTTGTWTINGFAGGFDTHRAVNFTTFNSGINYTSLLDTDDSSTVRNKYRTRAVTVDSNQETVTMLILVHNASNLDTGSVKVRPTFTGTPTIWQPFVTAQQIVNTLDVAFLATFAQPVSKFQIEITGKMEGISVYSLIANVIEEEEEV